MNFTEYLAIVLFFFNGELTVIQEKFVNANQCIEYLNGMNEVKDSSMQLFESNGVEYKFIIGGLCFERYVIDPNFGVDPNIESR